MKAPAELLENLWRGGEGNQAKLLDAAILLLLVSAGTWVFQHDPSGWIATNPSPFFLIPLLIGGKYGQISGLLSGAAAAILLLAAAALPSGQDPHELADMWKAVLLCLPLAGLICGEMRGVLYLDAARAGIQLKHASLRLRALDEKVFILSETKDELDREIALLNADTANLDYEIRRVLQSSPERFCDALLGVFCRKVGIYEAAIYLNRSGWHRAAFSGKPEIWPEQFQEKTSAVVRSALAHSSLVTLPQIWGNDPTVADDFLAACPIGEPGDPSVILLVRSMPFSSMNARGMQTIEIICRWVSEFAGLDRRAKGLFDPRGIVPIKDFESMVQLSCVVQTKFRLTSSIILFRPPPNHPATTAQIFRAVKGAVRVGDTLCSLDIPDPHILLLLPLTGRRGAEICTDRFREFAGLGGDDSLPLESRIFCTTEFSGKDALWTALHQELART